MIVIQLFVQETFEKKNFRGKFGSSALNVSFFKISKQRYIPDFGVGRMENILTKILENKTFILV